MISLQSISSRIVRLLTMEQYETNSRYATVSRKDWPIWDSMFSFEPTMIKQTIWQSQTFPPGRTLLSNWFMSTYRVEGNTRWFFSRCSDIIMQRTSRVYKGLFCYWYLLRTVQNYSNDTDQCLSRLLLLVVALIPGPRKSSLLESI
jgi:hypothetical protein